MREKKYYADEENVWNDEHFRHCWDWLIKNDSSPFKGAPTMLAAAMYITKERRKQWALTMRRKDRPTLMGYATRLKRTIHLKKILAGIITPVVHFRRSNGVVQRFEIVISANPVPLNCPPFYVGRINLGRGGPRVTLRRTDAMMVTRHDPEGQARLLNPFGRR